MNPSHLRSRAERMSSSGDQIREPPTQVDVASPSRPMVVFLAWDIAINATIPVACYWFSKRFVSRFVVRVMLVYRASAPVVLVVSPFLTGVATILTVMWTFWYAFKVRAQIAGDPGSERHER